MVIFLYISFFFYLVGHRFYKPVTYEFTLVRPFVRPFVRPSVRHKDISATETR